MVEITGELPTMDEAGINPETQEWIAMHETAQRVIKAYHELKLQLPEPPSNTFHLLPAGATVMINGRNITLHNPTLIAEGKNRQGKPSYSTRVWVGEDTDPKSKIAPFTPIKITPDQFDERLDHVLSFYTDSIPRSEA